MNAWETLTESVMVRRHNGECPYGPWLPIQNIDVPCWVGNLIADEIAENEAESGMIEQGGDKWIWKTD